MTVVTTEKTPCSADRPTAVRPRSTRCRKHAFARFSSDVSPGTQVQGYSPRSRHVSYDLHCRLAVECSVGRYYDPPTGQFLSVDPLVRQTQQPYLYAADNPVKFSDPTGLTWHLWMEQWLESGSNWTARGSFRSQTGYSTEAIIEVTGASSTPFYVVIDDNDPGSNLHRYHGAMRLS